MLRLANGLFILCLLYLFTYLFLKIGFYDTSYISPLLTRFFTFIVYLLKEVELCHLEKSKVTDYAAMMGIIYAMLKQDYTMQEKIVSSLNLKSSAGELESYCLMWSLRPFVNDEIMFQAWKLVT